MTITTNTTPSVWVGCLACYNGGHLVGRWIDADEAGDLTEEEIHTGEGTYPEALADYRRDLELGCPHEELWCMEHEGFGSWLTGECSPAEAQHIAEMMAECESEGLPVDAVGAYAENYHLAPGDVDLEDFRDAYEGEWESEQDYAMNFADEIGALEPDNVWPGSYIDWDSATGDLMMDRWTAPAAGGGVYVFSAL